MTTRRTFFGQLGAAAAGALAFFGIRRDSSAGESIAFDFDRDVKPIEELDWYKDGQIAYAIRELHTAIQCSPKKMWKVLSHEIPKEMCAVISVGDLLKVQRRLEALLTQKANANSVSETQLSKFQISRLHADCVVPEGYRYPVAPGSDYRPYKGKP